MSRKESTNYRLCYTLIALIGTLLILWQAQPPSKVFVRQTGNQVCTLTSHTDFDSVRLIQEASLAFSLDLPQNSNSIPALAITGAPSFGSTSMQNAPVSIIPDAPGLTRTNQFTIIPKGP
jgi:hypothetical protein